MIRVFLIEPLALARAALEKLLDSAPDFRVSGAAAGIGARTTAAFDVMLLGPDSVLPAMALARRPNAERGGPLACLLRHRAFALARPLLDCGVLGIVSDCSPPDEVFACLQRIHRGHVHLSPDIARRLAVGDPGPFDTLSAREWQVLLMRARGDSAQTISKTLYLSPKTVSTYHCRTRRKLGARNDLDLLRLVLRHGFMPLDPQVEIRNKIR